MILWQRFTSWILYRFFKCFESSAKKTTDAEPCVLLRKNGMAYPEILAQKFIFYPRPWKYLRHWNKSVLYLIIVSHAIQFDNITKKKASIDLSALGKDMHFVFGTVLYFSICFWVKTTNDCCKNPYCNGCSCG